MTNPWETTLASAVELLRDLPRRRGGVTGAQATVAAWAEPRSAYLPQLVVDAAPGTTVVDYDLLLRHPDGGTVALAAQREDGAPWSIDHSAHWAAHLVVTVNGYDLSYPRALDALMVLSGTHPDIRARLIDHCVLMNAIADDQEPSSPADLQAAADDFRRGYGLHSKEATLAWLEANGLDLATFEANVETAARFARLRRRTEALLGPGYLKDHLPEFDRVTAVWVESRDGAPLTRLLRDAGDTGDLFALLPELLATCPEAVSVRAATCGARELPEPLRELAAGPIVGPVRHGDGLLVGGLRHRESADPADPEVIAAAGRLAFQEWLVRQRADAVITWHW